MKKLFLLLIFFGINNLAVLAEEAKTEEKTSPSAEASAVVETNPAAQEAKPDAAVKLNKDGLENHESTTNQETAKVDPAKVDPETPKAEVSEDEEDLDEDFYEEESEEEEADAAGDYDDEVLGQDDDEDDYYSEEEDFGDAGEEI